MPVDRTTFSFELGNAAGRETARDVEIFLSYARAVTEDTAIGGPQRLPLVSGLTVPPGFRRPVTLLLLGHDITIRHALGSVDDGRPGVTAHHTSPGSSVRVTVSAPSKRSASRFEPVM